MNKPLGYDEAQVGGDFTPIILGGHHAGIVRAYERQNKNGGDMLVVELDFAKNDSQPGYFKAQFDADTRAKDEKKWPNSGTNYINVTGSDGKCSRQFKSFITSVERSNKFTLNWEGDVCAQLKNKRVGVVFGEVEEEYNGEVKTRRKIRWFCEDAKVSEQNIPERKTLPTISLSAPAAASGFMAIPEDSDEEIPF